MKTYECKPLFVPESEAQRHLPEGPRVLRNSSRGGNLLGWVAIQHGPEAATGSLEILNLASFGNESHPLPGRPGFFAETTRPDLVVVGLDRELALYDAASRRMVGRRIVVTGDDRVMINDGMAIAGGLLFGTKHITFTEHIARVYWFDAARGLVREMPEPQICSNGKFLYQDAGRQRLVDICSFSREVSLYDVDFPTGRMDRLGVVADLNGTGLFPDGLRPTPDGVSVIVAFYNPEPAPYGLARQYRIADGALEAEWRLPGSPRVTCPEWIEMDGGVRLLFTTAVEGMPAELREAAPLAGALFTGEGGWDRMPASPPLLDPAVFLE